MRATRSLAVLLAFALALAAAGCGDDDAATGDADDDGAGEDGGPAPVEGTPGGDETGLFVEVVLAGGFVPFGFDFRTPPTAVVYADGQVFAPGAMTMQYPGPAALPIFTGRLDDGAVQDLLAAAAEAGLLADQPPDLGDQDDIPVADASTTRVTVVVDGERHVVEAYALDIADGLPPELAEPRAAVAEFVAAVNEAVLAANEPFDADRYRVLASAPVDGATIDPAGPQPNEVAWPEGLPEPVEGRCTAITGEAVDAFEAALAGASELTTWRLGERTFSLVVRPVLPHEPDCPTEG